MRDPDEALQEAYKAQIDRARKPEFMARLDRRMIDDSAILRRLSDDGYIYQPKENPMNDRNCYQIVLSNGAITRTMYAMAHNPGEAAEQALRMIDMEPQPATEDMACFEQPFAFVVTACFALSSVR